jgi:hypothetical protein
MTAPNKKKTPWSESASELYRPSDRRLSAKLVPTFEDKGCYAVSVTDPYGRNHVFLDRSRYFFFQAAPQLYSRGWVDRVPDSLLRKSGSAGYRTRTSRSVVTRPQRRYAICTHTICDTFDSCSQLPHYHTVGLKLGLMQHCLTTEQV